MVGPGVSTQPATTPGAAAPGQPVKGLTVVDTAQAARVTAAPGQGFTVTTGEGFAATLRPRIQLRQTLGLGPGDVTSETQVRTLRLNLGGHVYSPELLYFVQLAFGGNDFDKDSSSPVFDAFVEHAGVRDARLRVGQFFVPFDRARTVREFALQLVDRQQAVRELSLDRDVGVMLWSPDLFGAKIAGYHVFIGSGEGRNRFGGKASGPLAVLRLVLRPFGVFDDDTEGDLARRASPRLALGAAGAFNWSAYRAQSTLGTTLANGQATFTHGAVDLVLKWHGVSVLAEALYRQASVDRLAGGTADKPTTEWTRSGWGYFVQAGVMLTDHLEVVGRWDELRARPGTDPALATLVAQQGRQAVGGANYYVHGHALKVQADYTQATGSAGTPHRLARLQLDASF
ncbi:MAG: porin [Myxococcales bacterium]|nr:MAG: porin [Myxococcales bacterium]